MYLIISEIPNIPYAEAKARTGRCIHVARSVAQADLSELDWEGQPALLKDFTGRPWIVRRFWGRAVAARELRALRRLSGLPGVPRLLATAGPEAFIIERLDAVRMPKGNEPPPPPVFWTNARRLLLRVHAAGAGHGDLRRKNILMGPHGEAYLIDFATTLCAPRKARGGARLLQALVRRYQRVDRVTYARIKASYAGAALDEEERRWLADEPWYLRLGRLLKKRVYRLRKGKFWRDQAKKARRWLRRKRHS